MDSLIVSLNLVLKFWLRRTSFVGNLRRIASSSSVVLRTWSMLSSVVMLFCWLILVLFMNMKW